jgi:hypothetical protein
MPEKFSKYVGRVSGRRHYTSHSFSAEALLMPGYLPPFESPLDRMSRSFPFYVH